MVKATFSFGGSKDRSARYVPGEHHETVENGASYGLSDTRLIGAMRLLLAVSALIFIWIDPLEPDRFVKLTYAALVLYVLYSFALYALARTQTQAMRTIRAWTHWLDVGWYSLLISLSSGTSSVFFFGFYFAIMVAAFRWGFWPGIRVTVASAVAFTAIARVARLLRRRSMPGRASFGDWGAVYTPPRFPLRPGGVRAPRDDRRGAGAAHA